MQIDLRAKLPSTYIKVDYENLLVTLKQMLVTFQNLPTTN